VDGRTLADDVRKLLLEGSSSTFVDDFTSWNFLWEAAIELNKEMQWNTGTKDITTVALTYKYTLPADFQELYMVNDFLQHIIKVYDGSFNTFIPWREYDQIYQYYYNNSTAVPIPTEFSIIDADTIDYVTGTATSTGALAFGESLLNDTAGPFGDISIGDTVHNVTDGSSGLVVAYPPALSYTAANTVNTALDGGTHNYWTSGDEYVVIPQGRMQLVLNPPPLNAGYTVTVPYVKRPNPVFSEYGTYNFPEAWRYALAKYAAWLYKYADKEPNYGDQWYKYYLEMLRSSKRVSKRVRERSSFKVNYNKRSLTDRSFR
jgi:hypothetical protein